MIDIETFGTTPGSVIWQIGACEFDPEGTTIHPGISIEIDVLDSMKHGLKLDWRTVHYWMTQNREAAASIPAPGKGLSLNNALVRLRQFLAPGCHVWGNGSLFDMGLLEHAYRLLGIDIPWHYRNVIDVRTVKLLVTDAVPAVEPKIPYNGLSDAEAQAKYVQNCFAKLRTPLVTDKHPLPSPILTKEQCDALYKDARDIEAAAFRLDMGVRDGSVSTEIAMKLGTAAVKRKQADEGMRALGLEPLPEK